MPLQRDTDPEGREGPIQFTNRMWSSELVAMTLCVSVDIVTWRSHDHSAHVSSSLYCTGRIKRGLEILCCDRSRSQRRFMYGGDFWFYEIVWRGRGAVERNGTSVGGGAMPRLAAVLGAWSHFHSAPWMWCSISSWLSVWRLLIKNTGLGGRTQALWFDVEY